MEISIYFQKCKKVEMFIYYQKEIPFLIRPENKIEILFH